MVAGASGKENTPVRGATHLPADRSLVPTGPASVSDCLVAVKFSLQKKCISHVGVRPNLLRNVDTATGINIG